MNQQDLQGARTMPETTLKASAKTDTATSLSFNATATIDIEGKARSDGKRLPTFAIKGYTGGVMNVGGFYNPVILDLGGIKAQSQTMPALLDHDTSQIVGQTESVTVGTDGVDFTGTIMGEDES